MDLNPLVLALHIPGYQDTLESEPEGSLLAGMGAQSLTQGAECNRARETGVVSSSGDIRWLSRKEKHLKHFYK